MTWKIWQICVHRLKNSNFIIESKMAKLYQSKNSKQQDRPDSVKTLFYLGNRILYFWEVLETIHKFIIELHVLQCLFVRGSNEKQRKGRIISNFTKRDFFISYDNHALLGVISQCGPPSWTLQKRSASPLQVWRRREYTCQESIV